MHVVLAVLLKVWLLHWKQLRDNVAPVAVLYDPPQHSAQTLAPDSFEYVAGGHWRLDPF